MSTNNNSTIAGHVINACLTMITVIAAFVVFIVDKRTVGNAYYVITIIAFSSFVTSIFFAGKGLKKQETLTGQHNSYFDLQAIAALTGIILFFISVFLVKGKSDECKEKIEQFEKRLIELEKDSNFKDCEIKNLIERVEKLEVELDEVKGITDPVS